MNAIRALEQRRLGADMFRPYHRDIAALGPRRHLVPGEVLLTLGVSTRPPRAALILEGLVKVTTVTGADPAAKNSILLSIRGPSSMVGEEAAFVRRSARELAPVGRATQVTALSKVTASVFPADDLRWYLVEHPDAYPTVVREICHRLAEAEDRIASASRDNPARRLARLLCELERYGFDDSGGQAPGRRLPVKLSQAELGSWIGVSRETASKILGGWRDRGIISTDYRTIIVHDFPALARIAGAWPATSAA